MSKINDEMFLTDKNNSHENTFFDGPNILKKKPKKQKSSKPKKHKKKTKKNTQPFFGQTDNFDPFFQFSNEEPTQESEILFGQFETSDFDQDEKENKKEKEKDRFSKIFDNFSNYSTKKKKKKKHSKRDGLTTVRVNNTENQKETNNQQNQIFSKRSIPIPVTQKFNISESGSGSSSGYGSGSEDETALQNNFALTFIQPHKYIESMQTEMERELSKSFNVPLKRVPSWRI
ncbi:hypothetical protein M0812_14084 [Anaeramoeba flamelloides]|uniref:Uncharacterized protein n=1 Tax=Anaeramoeba flamelloides TaxID=1746091 RepID=A0AAV7ZIZ9_9EUKA|nr:hypothetical protein M0812_14084 [Anaeramoeba flamelloides]